MFSLPDLPRLLAKQGFGIGLCPWALSSRIRGCAFGLDWRQTLREPRWTWVRLRCGRGQRPRGPVPRLRLFPQLLDDPLERLDDFVAVDAGLGEAQLKLERFAGGLVAEDVGFRPAGLGFGGLFP